MAENNNNNNSKGLAALTAEQRQTNEKLDQLIEVNDPTGARQTETRNEEAAGRKKELNYLKSMAAGITGLGKHFKGFGGKVGQTLKGFLKGTLMAAFLIALLAFLESDTWKEMGAISDTRSVSWRISEPIIDYVFSQEPVQEAVGAGMQTYATMRENR